MARRPIGDCKRRLNFCWQDCSETWQGITGIVLVDVMARVKLNGKDLGLLWCPPFRVDISKAAVPGKNELEIEVTNLWINRFIGDEVFEYKNIYPQIREGQPLPADRLRKTFEFRFKGGNAKHWKATDPLRPSGLLGPVRIHEEIEQ